MVSQRKVWANNGAVVNPTYDLVDPYGLIDCDETPLKLFRYRNQTGTYFASEISQIYQKKKFYLPAVSTLGDIHEAQPDIAKPVEKVPKAELDKLRNSVLYAVNQSKEMSQSYNLALKVWGKTSLDLEFYDLVIGKYFDHPLIKGLSIGSGEAAKEALRTLRNNIRAICFTKSEPNAFHWQHYGNNGKGVCYEIEDRYTYQFMSIYTPKEISYAVEKPKLTSLELALLLTFTRVHREWTLPFLSFGSRSHPFFEAVLKFVFQKQDIFKSESEVRLVHFASGEKASGGYVDSPGLILKRLIFGPRCDSVEILRVRKLLDDLGIDLPFVQSVASDGYDLKYLDL